jgi:hypothetical protein
MLGQLERQMVYFVASVKNLYSDLLQVETEVTPHDLNQKSNAFQPARIPVPSPSPAPTHHIFQG